jgi:hypothetical protein
MGLVAKRSASKVCKILGKLRDEKIIRNQLTGQRGWRRQLVRKAKKACALFGGKLPGH